MRIATILALAAAVLAAPAVAGAQTLFEGLDVNRDGFLDETELAAFADGGPAFAAHYLKYKDANGDRVLQPFEFESDTRVPPMLGAGRITLKGDLAKADADGDGKVTLAELKSLAPPEASEVMEAFLRQQDANKDGVLTREEWSKS